MNPSRHDALRIHGGPDVDGVPLHDFSTNSNACGPCPPALAAVQAADATRYPDAGFTAVRAALAAFHGVDVWRVVLAGSASEFIFRMTAWTVQQGGRSVWLPNHAYGDYAHAAQAWGLDVVADADAAALVWACEPSSPLGQAHAVWPAHLNTVVLDSAYAPLRLSGAPSLNDARRGAVWQLFSPNKALGLTGVRAAYAIAPHGAAPSAQQLDALAPSWVLGAQGAAMLQAWTRPDTQAWLQQSLQTLRGWKQRQVDAQALCVQLRSRGTKLRNAASFGLPGLVRLGVLPPPAQDALLANLMQNISTMETTL